MKYLGIIFFILFFSLGNAQPIQQRGTASVTVQDARWAAQYNMYVPRYSDTTAANLQKGIDTSGAMIYCYNTQTYWYRQTNPKKWINLSSGGNIGNTIYTGDGTLSGNRNINGNVPTQNLPDLIYQVRKSVEYIYINNSEDENLQANANYLYNLCNKYIKKSIEIYG